MTNKCNDKFRWEVQNFFLKNIRNRTNVAKNCLEDDDSNELIHSKDIVSKVIDVIALLELVNHQLTFNWHLRSRRLRYYLPSWYIIAQLKQW